MELDLVQMSETDKDGVATCKIMNYGKFLYSQEKKSRANKKSKQDTKEVRLSDTIADNDMKTKAKNTDKFLESGDKVVVYVQYRGRQIAYISRGFDVINKFMTFLNSDYKVVKPSKVEGSRVSITLEANHPKK